MSFKSKFLMIVLSASLAMYSIAGAWIATDRKSTRLNSSHSQISYAVFCLKKKVFHDGFQITRPRLLIGFTAESEHGFDDPSPLFDNCLNAIDSRAHLLWVFQVILDYLRRA